MRSFLSVAGLLAAVGPAVAVPQQYTGYYPMPNGTHPTGPHGTGYSPSYSHPEPTSTSTTTYHRTSTTTSTHYLTLTRSSGSSEASQGVPATQVTEQEATTTTALQETGCAAGGETVTVTSKERITVTVVPGATEEQATYPATPSQYTQKHGHSHFHHSKPTHSPSAPVSTHTGKPYGFPNGTTSSFPGTGFTSYPSYTWTPPSSPSSFSYSKPTHMSSSYSVPAPSSSTQAPVSSSSTYQTPSSYSTKAPTTSSTQAPSSTKSTAAPTYTSTPSNGKRGLSYNDASMTDPFEQYSSVNWAYNWGSSSDGLPKSFSYVPMLWGNSDDFTGDWSSNVNQAIAEGSTEVFAFNEPDMSTQSNMDPATAADAFKTYMSPLSGKVRIGSPSVTNGAAPMGIDWLSNFMQECSDCPVDFVTIHWYDSASNAQYFKDHVTEAHQKTGKPVWVTEFGATGSDDEICSFLEDVMSWMDQQSFVEKYAYFMAADGYLNSGSSLSQYGTTYATDKS